MHSPVNHYGGIRIASPIPDTIQQKRKGTNDQQQFDKYSN